MAAERRYGRTDDGVYFDGHGLGGSFETDLPSKRCLMDYEMKKRMFLAAEENRDVREGWEALTGLRSNGCTQT